MVYSETSNLGPFYTSLLYLPFAEEPILEDEHHVLSSCPSYHHLRLQLSDHIKSSLLAWDERVPTLFDEPTVHEFALYVHKIFQLRFPKRKKDGTKGSKTTTQPITNKLIVHHNRPGHQMIYNVIDILR